jgi:8-oxo-dGTP pyrophosphatase MutT (NUDIX family)
MLSIEHARFTHGEGLTQEALDALILELQPQKARLRPADKDESLPLFDRQGQPLGLSAPRWICHILGLRHRCVHVFLLWESPALGETLILQVRAWDRDDSPGYLDVSVGGHATAASSDAAAAALKELGEETGLQAEDLVSPLQPLGGYTIDDPERPDEKLWNSERRELFIGRLQPERMSKIHFQDGELAGLFLVPIRDARALLKQSTLPLAGGLKVSLPRFLDTVFLQRLFSFFRKLEVLGPERLPEILDLPLCTTECLFEEEDGQNTRFTDSETITYFYDFSSVELDVLPRWQLDGCCVYQARGSDSQTVGARLQRLLDAGKKVTHIVRSQEEYGGGTHDSVWREYLRAEIVKME